MSDEEKKPAPLISAITDHSPEGIEILYSEPSRVIRAFNLLILALVVAGFVWSFIGRADVIVTASGVLGPEDEVRRVYAPVDGELIDLYIAEGLPVSEGDVLARINARGAIQAATDALEAELKLAEVEQEYREFPQRRELMQRHADSLARQIETAAQLHEKRITDGLEKLAQAQKARLEEARGNLEKAGRQRAAAKRELGKLQRLFAKPGGGGVSRNKVDEARDAYHASETDYRLAEAKLGELEFQLSEEYAEARADLEGSDQRLTELRIEQEQAINEIRRTENRIELEYQSARLAAEAAARIRFENIDEENFLRILAPVSGVITSVTFTQPGDKIQANTPLASIAPAGASAVLKVDILGQDRGFLREGLPVKMKFNAFPYQRYGFIDGSLEYISPSTQKSTQSEIPVYKGHVVLDRDYFTVGEMDYPLRYGMAATAEIVIRKRRLIDMALDPLRKI
jgi:HlyD family secretion protein